MKTLKEMIITATLTGKTYISNDICYNSNKGFHWRYSKEPFNGEVDYLVEDWQEYDPNKDIDYRYKVELLNICNSLINQLTDCNTLDDYVYLVDTHCNSLAEVVNALIEY